MGRPSAWWDTEPEELQSSATPRCYKPVDFGQVAKAEIHHFLDTSFKAMVSAVTLD